MDRTKANARLGRVDAYRRRGFKTEFAWQKAPSVGERGLSPTSDWPREELYGLTSQVRRAAVSVPSNLAEGHGRTGPREFAHHVSVAYGSLCELETQVSIAEQLGYLTT